MHCLEGLQWTVAGFPCACLRQLQHYLKSLCCNLQELFKEKHYTDLDGGILEGFGRLLKYDLKLYVYPTKDDRTGQLVTADTLKVSTAEPVRQALCAE